MGDESTNGADAAYDSSEIRGMILVKIALGLLLGLVVVMLALLPWHREQVVTPAPSPAGPGLLAHPVTNLAEYRAAQKRRLEGYGWVDREAGIAHIPVERAVQIQIERAGSSPEAAP